MPHAAAGHFARSLSRLLTATIGCVVSLAGQAFAQSPPSLRWDGQFEVVSGFQVEYAPIYPGWGTTRASSQAISGDGRWVVYTTDLDDLQGLPAAVLLDRRTGDKISYIVENGFTTHAAISADGNHVAWDVCQPNVETGVTCEVRALDRRTGAQTWLSAALDGTVSLGMGHAAGAVLSGTGRFVVFTADDPELTGDAVGRRHVVLLDRDPDLDGLYDEPGEVLRETISVAPTGFGDDESATAVVSDDGRFVAFRSLAGNLVAGDAPGTWDVFLRDRQSADTRRLNVRPEGAASPDPIDEPRLSISADGRFVAFSSTDGLLAPSSLDDTNGVRDVFVYDRQAFALSRIDVGQAAGTPALGDGATGWPTLSADGRYVVLQSAARNVAAPPPAGTEQVYVVDRATGAVSRISVLPDGTDPDASSVEPTISADGSVVVFASAATNYVDFEFESSAPHQLYAAAHLSIDPTEFQLTGGDGTVPAAVTAQQHTRWWLTWDYEGAAWFGWMLDAEGPGNGAIRVGTFEWNPATTTRHVDVRIGARTFRVTQGAALSLASVSPAEGPREGGTPVTLDGTGFEPGMSVSFDGQPAPIQSMTSTTMVVTAPPYDGVVDVTVYAAPGRTATLADAFRYTGDATPPVVNGTLTGTMGQNGWFVGNVTVTWAKSDPESPITSSNCSTSTYTADTSDQTVSCYATSAGGTTWGFVTFKKDATAPVVTIAAPQRGQLVAIGSQVAAAFTCSDTPSGVAACGAGAPSGTLLDTSSPGLKLFTSSASDAAGNTTAIAIPYGVANGVCSAPPNGIKSWARFEDSLADAAMPANVLSVSGIPASYAPGQVGRAFDFPARTSGGMSLYHNGRLAFTNRLSVAAWVKPALNAYESGTIFHLPGQLRLNASPMGTLTWTMNTPPLPPGGWTEISGTSSSGIPSDAWSHVVVTFDSGALRIYVNGRLDGEWTALPSALRPASGPWFQLGYGPDYSGYARYLAGGLDEWQVYDRALDASDAVGLYLAGPDGVCPPAATTLSVAPVTTTYNVSPVPVTAVLRDGYGQPVAGKTLSLSIPYGSAPSASLTTDGTGTVRWDAPLTLVPGSYPAGIQASFTGDAAHAGTSSTGSLTVEKITPTITWPAPAPIVYGTALGLSQLNATVDVSGTLTYAPAAGTVLTAGIQPLQVSFVPHSSQAPYYTSASSTVSLEVRQATPTLTVTGGTFPYDALPHAATATASGIGGEVPPGAVTITYNGGTTVPVDAGTYAVTASIAAAGNYSAASGSTTLIITKAAPVLAWSAPDAITYGTALSAAQLNATASVPGTFAYSPAAATVLNAGAGQTLTATFTPTDSQNYEAGSVSTTIAVLQATPTLTVTGGTFTYDGEPHAAAASATGIGGVSLAPLSVTYNGAAAVPVAAGTYDVVATFAGDANYAPGTASATITIGRATVVPSWNAPAAIGYGTPLSAAQLTATANVPGTFVYTPAAGIVLGAGTHALSATFTPADAANYTGGPVGTTISVTPAPLVVRTNDAAKVYGAPLPGFTASFAGLVNGDTPASLGGTLAFATAATASSAVGTYTVTPAGLTSSNYAIAFAAGTLAIARAPVAMTVSTSPTPSGVDMPITFTATVAAAQAAPTAPTGTVQFFDGTALLGTASLTGGTATLLTGGLASGSHAIEARYAGDASFDAGTTTATHVVNTAAATPAIAITSSRQPASIGQSVTLTATITVATSGTIAFYDGGTLLGSSAIASGRATLTTSSLPAGSHAITARFQGTASAPPAISPVFVQAITSNGWKDRSSTTSLASSANPSALGDPVTFTATVSGSSGTPAGRVLFMVDGLVVGDPTGVALATVNSSTARAAIAVPGLTGGRHKVTATYLGSANYRGSTGAVTQTVN